MPFLRRPPPAVVIAPLPDVPVATPPPETPAGAAQEVPRDTSPTWELELLVSGAVLFALFQLPPLADSLQERLFPRLGREMGVALVVGYWYVKAILYALIAAFVLHLSVRAYWVALVGLNSVFPNGVDWERSGSGPITRAVYRERLSSLPAVISRTDNFCSGIFAFAFLTVFGFAFSILMVGLVGAASYGVSQALLGGRHAMAVFYGLVTLFLFPPMVAGLVDKRMGERLDPAGAGARLIRGAARFAYRWMGVGLSGPVMLTLFSNVRKGVIYPVFFLFTFGTLGVVIGEMFARTGMVSFDSYAYIPEEAGAFGVDFRHYEDQRPEGEVFDRLPSIQSDVVREPYVRLFLPYEPYRHNAALARCPGARARGAAGADSAAGSALACLARLHALAINGRPRPEVELRFYTHPGSGMRGMIAYVSTADLPRGRNVITVRRAPRPSLPGEPVPEPPKPWVIPFWL